MECSTINLLIQGAVAFGTVGALIVALVQIWLEKQHRTKEQKRVQAVKVATWFEGVKLSSGIPGNQYNAYRTALIRNDNLMPIYDVVITVVGLHGSGPAKHGEDNEGDFQFRTILSQVPTGLWGTRVDTAGGTMGVVDAPEIAFRDSAGVSWIRRSNGELEEIKENPLTYYSIPWPTSWSHLERVSL